MNNPSYSTNFFATHEERSVSSAKEIIPLVLNYIKPASVIDIGCGNGTWLKVWNEFGVNDFLGVDGDYVKPEQLLIEKSHFQPFNLEEGYTATRKYDLVTSMEVAEHLKPEFASRFVQSLCGLGDIILFSAAIPGQPGTFHFNEQYPDYWAALFKKEGYAAIDCLRQKIWLNEKIEWWYRQNVLLFVKKEVLDKYAELKAEYEKSDGTVLSMVHPCLLEEKIRLAAHYKSILQNPVKAFTFLAKKVVGK